MLSLSVLGGLSAIYYILFALCSGIEHLKWKEEASAIRSSLFRRRNLGTAALGLFLIYLASVTTIIRANVQYIDDMERTFTGNPAFQFSSRHLSNFLIRLIGTESSIADLSPLSTLIAIVFLTLSSLILILLFTDRTRITLWNVISALPLGLCPYFTECLLYKYDAPYMALSMLSSIFPLLFFGSNPLLYFLSVFAGILITCPTYQAALGIFPVLVILLLFHRWQNGANAKALLEKLIPSVVSYLLAVFVYKIFLMTPLNTYITTSIFPLKELIPGVISNLNDYYTLVLRDFDAKWLVCTAIIFSGFLITSSLHSSRPPWLTGLAALCVLALCLFLCFGLYIAFVVPLFSCRAMFGFGVTIAAFAVISTDCQGTQPLRLACLYLSWCFFVFSFCLGNALAEQQRYVDFRTEMVLADLDDISVLQSEETINLQITGSAGFAPAVERLYRDYEILDRLIGTTFSGDGWYWGSYAFYHFYDLPQFQEANDLTEKNLPLVHDGYYHRIYADDNNLLIILNPH